MPLASSATVMSGGGVFTSVTSSGFNPAFSRMRQDVEVIDGAEGSRDLLALQAGEVALDDAGTLAGDDGHGGVGAGLGGVAAVIAERHQIHAAQHRADHGHADLHDLAFAGLQRIERIDAGGIGAGDGDVEPALLEEAALQRDRQPDLVDSP